MLLFRASITEACRRRVRGWLIAHPRGSTLDVPQYQVGLGADSPALGAANMKSIEIDDVPGEKMKSGERSEEESRRIFSKTVMSVDGFPDSAEVSELWCVVMFSRNSPLENTRGQHQLSGPTNMSTKKQDPGRRFSS